MDKQLNVKELYYESDTYKHKQIVADKMIKVVRNLLERAIKHDDSKLEESEKKYYINPVFILNTEEIPFGSTRYTEVIKEMDKGWEHHKMNNDHHIEFFVPYSVQTLNDPVLCMDLISLIEMCCDWIAAASRKGNRPEDALKYIEKKYPINVQLRQVIINTINMIEELK